jgi:nucleotide-binding universal stress UspA family protein
MPVGRGAGTVESNDKEDPMKILLAYDGSESAKRALDHAAGLSQNGSSLSVISVAEELPQIGRAAAMLVPEEDAERRRELLEAKAALKERGIDAKLVERVGDPADRIIDEAESEQADLVVMGSRGLNTAQRWLLGSVSTKVVQHAPCNVFVVR